MHIPNGSGTSVTRREFEAYVKATEELVTTKEAALILSLQTKAKEYEVHFKLLDIATADLQKAHNQLRGALYLVGIIAASGAAGWIWQALVR